MNYIIVLVVVFAFIAYVLFAPRTALLKVGARAPEFTLQDDTGAWRTLSSFGPKVVLYFYPKDGTSGCTSEACSLRDGYKELQNNKITVVGVSYDSPESHRAFKQQHTLPFTLLSDTKKEVARAYGTYTPVVPRRVTYLIQDGIIKHVLVDVDVNNHSAQIIAAFNK